MRHRTERTRELNIFAQHTNQGITLKEGVRHVRVSSNYTEQTLCGSQFLMPPKGVAMVIIDFIFVIKQPLFF